MEVDPAGLVTAIFLVAFTVRLLDPLATREALGLHRADGRRARLRRVGSADRQLATGPAMTSLSGDRSIPNLLGSLQCVAGRDLLIVRVCQAAIGSLACVLRALPAVSLLEANGPDRGLDFRAPRTAIRR